MTRRINVIDWTPTSKVNNQRVSILVCDAALDLDWITSTIGTDVNGDEVIAAYAIVDNLLNSLSCTIKYGPLTFNIAPFTRRTFTLPNGTLQVEIIVPTGIVTLTLCESNMNVPDETNQQASSSSGNTVGEYNPWMSVTGPLPTADELLCIHPFEEPVLFQPNWNGIAAHVDAGSLPTADSTITLQKNGVTVGSVVFHSTGAFTATSIGGVAVTFAVNDVLTFLAQHVPDATFANFAINIPGTPV